MFLDARRSGWCFSQTCKHNNVPQHAQSISAWKRSRPAILRIRSLASFCPDKLLHCYCREKTYSKVGRGTKRTTQRCDTCAASSGDSVCSCWPAPSADDPFICSGSISEPGLRKRCPRRTCSLIARSFSASSCTTVELAFNWSNAWPRQTYQVTLARGVEKPTCTSHTIGNYSTGQ